MALAELREAGWEGDGKPMIGLVPEANEDGWPRNRIVTVKQQNNGTVWIRSPCPLPWLDEHEVSP